MHLRHRRRKRGGPPMSAFADSYIGRGLKPFEAQNYKAAGILPLLRLPESGEVRARTFEPRALRQLIRRPQVAVLLAKEHRIDRSRRTDEGEVASILGGKVEAGDGGAGARRAVLRSQRAAFGVSLTASA